MITEKVVLSAAHCVNGDPSKFKIGLGLHNVSGYTQWSEKEWEKHILLEVKEIIQHDEFSLATVLYDFSLFILRDPARLSRAVSPVCLPHKYEVDEVERKENILIGFGTSKVWFMEYKKLLGGKLQSASLIPPEVYSNKSAAISAFTNDDFHKNVLDGYFETFIKLFPGIEKCINKYEFVCEITDQKLDVIASNIKEKIHKSGSINEDNDVAEFLGQFTSKLWFL